LHLSSPPQPAPAPLAPRLLAGAIDTSVVLGLCAIYFLIPLLTRGLVLPMWGVLAAVLGYLVVPLSAFKRTFGMRMFGLELVTKDGHAVGAGDVLFRELIGRGFFPAAFLITVLAGLIASWLHIAAFAFPSGMAGLFFTASMFAVAFAALGHALVLNRADRRSLADLMARSYVRLEKRVSLPTDADELADWKAQRKAKVRNVVLFEVALVVGALALPWVLTQRTESTATYAARLKRQQLEARAKAEPDNQPVLEELARALYFEGRAEEAEAVRQQIGLLLTRRKDERFVKLKAQVEASPNDERALVELLDEYEERGLMPEAKTAYRRFLDASSDHELRAGFGRWLWRRGFAEEGLTEVRATQKADPTLEGLHALLGRILADTDRLEEAQVELFLAMLEDPDDDDSAGVLAAVDTRIGALAAPKQKQLKAEFEKSRPH
jgi:uncharacterized RDD family membrane protein YckC